MTFTIQVTFVWLAVILHWKCCRIWCCTVIGWGISSRRFML